jgi:hypothetical protein
LLNWCLFCYWLLGLDLFGSGLLGRDFSRFCLRLSGFWLAFLWRRHFVRDWGLNGWLSRFGYRLSGFWLAFLWRRHLFGGWGLNGWLSRFDCRLGGGINKFSSLRGCSFGLRLGAQLLELFGGLLDLFLGLNLFLRHFSENAKCSGK